MTDETIDTSDSPELEDDFFERATLHLPKLVSVAAAKLPSTKLSELQQQARLEGRSCVVSALISNKHNQLFFQRRSAEAFPFPNCWDVVGGHVEAGESLEQALAREIREETGWSLASLELLQVFDWQVEQEGKPSLKREFAFLARVEGDLSQPTIESQFCEYRWLHKVEASILKGNRDTSDTVIYGLALLAFQAMRQPA